MNNFPDEVKAILLPKDDTEKQRLSVLYDPLFNKQAASTGLRKSKTLDRAVS